MVERSLPNLIIAGVPKAATTSLFMYLSAHPDICPSSIKETQYFLPLRYGATKLPPITEYLKYFKHCRNTKYTMEATLGYIYGGKTLAQAIKDTLGTIKIIFVLRDPTERVFSFYKFEKNELRLDRDLSLKEYIQRCESFLPEEIEKRENNLYWAIGGSLYANYLPDWFDVFGDEAIKVIFFEYLKSNSIGVLTDLCQWLEIEVTNFIRNLDLTVENKSVHYKNHLLQWIALNINWRGEKFWRAHPLLKRRLRKIYYALNGQVHAEKMSNETRAYLDSIFHPYNKKLAIELVKRGYRNLPDWLSKELQD